MRQEAVSEVMLSAPETPDRKLPVSYCVALGQCWPVLASAYANFLQRTGSYCVIYKRTMEGL